MIFSILHSKLLRIYRDHDEKIISRREARKRLNALAKLAFSILEREQ